MERGRGAVQGRRWVLHRSGARLQRAAGLMQRAGARGQIAKSLPISFVRNVRIAVRGVNGSVRRYREAVRRDEIVEHRVIHSMPTWIEDRCAPKTTKSYVAANQPNSGRKRSHGKGKILND